MEVGEGVCEVATMMGYAASVIRLGNTGSNQGLYMK